MADNKTKSTIKAYESDMGIFCKFLLLKKGDIELTYVNRDGFISAFEKLNKYEASDELLLNVEREDVWEFLLFLEKDLGNNEYARARKLACLKSFYIFLMDEEIIDKNPTRKMNIKLPKKVADHLELDEIKRLYCVIDGPFKERDYAIIGVALNCGLRLSEVVSLNLYDIKRDRLIVNGKGNKQREVPLNSEVKKIISDYLQVRPSRHEIKPGHQDALFISKRKTRISKRTIEHMMANYLKESGINKDENPGKYTFHTLRHTCATHLRRDGADIVLIKEVLGHENMETTKRYAHTNFEEMHELIRHSSIGKVGNISEINKIPSDR